MCGIERLASAVSYFYVAHFAADKGAGFSFSDPYFGGKVEETKLIESNSFLFGAAYWH